MRMKIQLPAARETGDDSRNPRPGRRRFDFTIAAAYLLRTGISIGAGARPSGRFTVCTCLVLGSNCNVTGILPRVSGVNAALRLLAGPTP
jgi:hypothetical protein